MWNTLVQLMIVATIALLLMTLVNLRDIYKALGTNRIRTAWLGLALLIPPAIVGCGWILRLNYREATNHQESWSIAGAALTAAVFMFVVSLISRYSATDLARIAGLEQAAYFDQLTTLCSRARICSLLELECLRSQRMASPVSVLLLDLDDFKFINDCFGHQAGDYVLQQSGRILKECVGGDGPIGRYGGEEFLIILPDTTALVATEVAERIRSTFATERFSFNWEKVPVTASVGIATSVTFSATVGELISEADRAMYAAKSAGRNKVFHYESISLRKSASRARVDKWTG